MRALINGLLACWVNCAPDLDAAGGHVELLGETLAFLRAGEGGALVSRVEDAELVRVCAFALLLHERLVGGPVAGGGGEVGAAGPCVAVLRRRRRERVRGVWGRVLVVGVMGSLGVAGVVVVVMVVVVAVGVVVGGWEGRGVPVCVWGGGEGDGVGIGVGVGLGVLRVLGVLGVRGVLGTGEVGGGYVGCRHVGGERGVVGAGAGRVLVGIGRHGGARGRGGQSGLLGVEGLVLELITGGGVVCVGVPGMGCGKCRRL